MAGRLGFTMIDHSRERASFSLPTGDVTAVSLPGLLTQVGTLRSAIEGITLGNVAAERLSVFDTPLTAIPPEDENAQRERGWLVTYADNTQFFDDPVNAIPNEAYGRLYTLTIPTAAVEGLLQANSDFADLEAVAMATFIAALEDVARSPAGGEIQVISVKKVGRNT